MALGCSVWTVRTWRSLGQHQRCTGLSSQMGRPSTGPLGMPSVGMREAILQMRRTHPGCGPTTLLARVSMENALLENDPGVREMFDLAFLLRGHMVSGYADPFEFLLGLLGATDYDVLLADDHLPGCQGSQVIRVLRLNHLPCMLMRTTPRFLYRMYAAGSLEC